MIEEAPAVASAGAASGNEKVEFTGGGHERFACDPTASGAQQSAVADFLEVSGCGPLLSRATRSALSAFKFICV